MRIVKGTVMPKREVPCAHCGAPVWRAVHFVDAKCHSCKRKGSTSRYRAWLIVLRAQARHYRVICHVLGWEPDQFPEMLEEMKRSPMMFRRKPETRQAKADYALERRRRGVLVMSGNHGRAGA